MTAIRSKEDRQAALDALAQDAPDFLASLQALGRAFGPFPDLDITLDDPSAQARFDEAITEARDRKKERERRTAQAALNHAKAALGPGGPGNKRG